MEISLRSTVTAGLTALAASAVVVAPAARPEPLPTVHLATPVQLAAASDVVYSVYQFVRPWANYASTELTPYVLQFIPYGWVVTDQINIWYYPFVLRTTDSFVYDFLGPVVDNPLNLGVWVDGGLELASETIAGAINGGIGEFNYFFGWLIPPIPPLPGGPLSLTTATARSTSAAPLGVTELSSLTKAALAPLQTIADSIRVDLTTGADIAQSLRNAGQAVVDSLVNAPLTTSLRCAGRPEDAARSGRRRRRRRR